MQKEKMSRHRKFTNAEIYSTIQKVVTFVDEGDSLGLAMKKACGGSANALSKQIKATEIYLFMLNKYVQRKKNLKFKRISGKIRMIMN
jgi:hypothetical protein